jgi:hypothetical protein
MRTAIDIAEHVPLPANHEAVEAAGAELDDELRAPLRGTRSSAPSVMPGGVESRRGIGAGPVPLMSSRLELVRKIVLSSDTLTKAALSETSRSRVNPLTGQIEERI